MGERIGLHVLSGEEDKDDTKVINCGREKREHGQSHRAVAETD